MSPPASPKPSVLLFGVGLLAAALAQAALGPSARRAPVLMGAEPARSPPRFDPRLEPSFQAEMTPDDVARGLRRLAERAEPSLALTDAQRAVLGPKVQAARAARAEVDALRDEQRRARQALGASGQALLWAVWGLR